MMSTGRILGTALLTLFLCGIALDAAAQLISNKPYEFSRRGGGGVGMSLGYRQAIIEEQLFNRRPENLLRDATGALLEIERGPSNQAFVRQQASPFLPGASAGVGPSGGGFSAFVGGVGLSVGGFGIGFEYGLAQSVVPLSSYSSPPSTPIDAWISQLYSGHSSTS